MKNKKAKSLIGCCGLYCGFCTRFQSKAPGRCTGCRGNRNKPDIGCSVYRCCAIKKRMTTCANCNELPCKFVHSVLHIRPDGTQYDSFITGRKALENLDSIKNMGLEIWSKGQQKKQAILEIMLDNYNEGRSKTLYCTAATLMPINLIKKAIEATEKKPIPEQKKYFKILIQDLASKSDIDLKLRKEKGDDSYG